MAELNHFRSFEIAQREDGSPLELLRDDSRVVCLGFDTNRRCFVEVCALAAGDGDDFLERAAAVASQSHPALASVVDYGSEEGVFFYASDIVDGEPLEHFVDRVKRVPPEVAVGWMKSLTQGVVALHEIGLDPPLARARMVQGAGGRVGVKLADFGIARSSPQPFAEAILGLLQRLTNFQDADEAPVYPREVDTLFDKLAENLTPPEVLQQLDDYGSVELEPLVSEALRPRLLLEREIYRHVRPEHVLPGRYRIIERTGDRDPYEAIVEDEDGQRLRILALPPARLLSERMLDVYSERDCVAATKVKVYWQHEDFRLVGEQFGGGFSLAEWMRARPQRSTAEVVKVLEALDHSLADLGAADLRIQRLHPEDCFFAFDGAAPEQDSSPVDDWAAVNLHLRTHPTMRGLSEVSTEEVPAGAEDVMSAAKRGDLLPAEVVIAWYFNLRNRGLHYQAAELVASLRDLASLQTDAPRRESSAKSAQPESAKADAERADQVKPEPFSHPVEERDSVGERDDPGEPERMAPVGLGAMLGGAVGLGELTEKEEDPPATETLEEDEVISPIAAALGVTTEEDAAEGSIDASEEEPEEIPEPEPEPLFEPARERDQVHEPAAAESGPPDDVTDNPIARGMQEQENSSEPRNLPEDVEDLLAEGEPPQQAGCNVLLLLFILIAAVAVAAAFAHLTGKAFWLHD